MQYKAEKNNGLTLPLYICMIVLKLVVVTFPFGEDLFNIDSCRDRYKPLLYYMSKYNVFLL